MSVPTVDTRPATPPPPAPRVGAPPVLLFGREPGWAVPLPATLGPLLLFTSCDSRYLDFAVSLLRSIDLFSPGFVVILHLINPTRHDLERVRCVAETLNETRLAVSLERIDLNGLTPAQRRAYYASARFIRLAELLPECNCPVLSLDADSLVVAPIDLDFSDEPAAEICLVRRDLAGPVAENAAVANGSVWIRPTPGAQAVLDAVAAAIADAFAGGAAAWFVDQIVMGRQVKAFDAKVAITDLKPRYADWRFADGSVVWAGKGRRKNTDMRFAVLQRMLLDDPKRQALAAQVAAELFPANATDNPGGMMAKLQAARRLVPTRVALFLPRLDQPWGSSFSARRLPPPLSAETLALRLHWKEFAARLANAIERRGVQVDTFEWPAREIEPQQVDAVGAQLALIPHRCKLDYAAEQTPALFYMQEYFRWVFVVDPEGWSAASSRYPIDTTAFAGAPAGAFDEYRRRLAQGQLRSKFGQPTPVSREALQASGQIPAGPYVFMPLQIPHDQSIRYFSGVSEEEVVAALVRWCRDRRVPLVLKPHPNKSRTMAAFEQIPRDEWLYWSTANVQDLIDHATAVYTINSGVGFEALLQLKPVVTFGRAEYDCVTVGATIATLDDAWRQVQASAPDVLATRYAAFVDWFLACYAVDLSLEAAGQQRLEAMADDIAQRARAGRPVAGAGSA